MRRFHSVRLSLSGPSPKRYLEAVDTPSFDTDVHFAVNKLHQVNDLLPVPYPKERIKYAGYFIKQGYNLFEIS